MCRAPTPNQTTYMPGSSRENSVSSRADQQEGQRRICLGTYVWKECDTVPRTTLGPLTACIWQNALSLTAQVAQMCPLPLLAPPCPLAGLM
jgi:hypothetical protein